MHALANFADGWILRLLAASLQGALLAAGVWLLCRWVPSLPAATRGRLWWLVCAQMLLGLLWPDAMKLHPLHQPPALVSSPSPGLPAASDSYGTTAETTPPTTVEGMPAQAIVRTMIPVSRLPGWRTLLLLSWALGTSAGLLLLVREYRLHERRLRLSHPAACDLQQLLEREARTVGLHRVPTLRIAPDIRSPQVIGLRRPTVLMPEQDLATWSQGDLVLALRHECLHLRHHDLWWSWGPVLAQRLFFFNPVAALAAREFALAREAAVDEALLRQPDVSARRYGELLLRLGVSVSGTTAMATASPSFRILHRRLTMMNALSTRGRAANVAGTLALLLVAGASLPLSATPATRAATPAIPAVSAVPMLAAAAIPAPAAPPQTAAPAAVPPVAPVTATPAAPAVPAVSGRHLHEHSNAHNSTYVFSDGESGTTLDIDKDDDGHETKIIVSGRGRDAQILKITQDPASHASRMWYHDGSKSYVIDDAATMARVSAVLESTMKQLGEQQGKLGEQQGLLGGKQAELGAEQARLGAEQARLAAEMQRASRHAADEKAIEDLERQQEALDKQQDALGKQQDEIGEQQDALGKKQDEIGKQQDEAARAAGEQIHDLMQQAIDGGQARPEKS